jgi:hypothetical protein
MIREGALTTHTHKVKNATKQRLFNFSELEYNWFFFFLKKIF